MSLNLKLTPGIRISKTGAINRMGGYEYAANAKKTPAIQLYFLKVLLHKNMEIKSVAKGGSQAILENINDHGMIDPANATHRAAFDPTLFFTNRYMNKIVSDVTNPIKERNPVTEFPKINVHKTSPYRNGGVYTLPTAFTVKRGSGLPRKS
jgi:hypothetical protein